MSSDLFQLGELEVLLLDGDARSRRTLQELLENWNLRPTLAESLGSAVRTVREAERKSRPFQLVNTPDRNEFREVASGSSAELGLGLAG